MLPGLIHKVHLAKSEWLLEAAPGRARGGGGPLTPALSLTLQAAALP